MNRLDALHTVTCMSHGVLIRYKKKGPMISGRRFEELREHGVPRLASSSLAIFLERC